MRNLCIGKCVEFRIERTTSEGKSYGPVTIQGKDAALPAVSVGWAKVSIFLFLELEVANFLLIQCFILFL